MERRMREEKREAEWRVESIGSLCETAERERRGKRGGREKKNVVFDVCFGVVGGAVSRKGSHGKQSV